MRGEVSILSWLGYSFSFFEVLSCGSINDVLCFVQPGVGADEARSRMWLFDSKVRWAYRALRDELIEGP